MSNYVIYYSARKSMYRELANRWLKWSSTANLTEEEVMGITKFFKSIAVRFGLIKEFREIGII